MNRLCRVLVIALVLVFAISGSAWARPTYTNKLPANVTGVELVALGDNYYQIHVEWDLYAGKPIGAYVWGTNGEMNSSWPFQKFTRAELALGEATLTHAAYGGYHLVPGDYTHLYVVLCTRKTEDWHEITALLP